MASEAARVVRYADLSLNSEIDTDRRPRAGGGDDRAKIHDVILMLRRRRPARRHLAQERLPADRPRGRQHRRASALAGHRHQPHLLRRGDSRRAKTSARSSRSRRRIEHKLGHEAGNRLGRELLFRPSAQDQDDSAADQRPAHRRSGLLRAGDRLWPIRSPECTETRLP
ncbi:MAG: hypothetical protein MZW92_12625 [Comamonadaceae bacterium]|nr:hypothetical protein [Comamonadaceae bacterium]